MSWQTLIEFLVGRDRIFSISKGFKETGYTNMKDRNVLIDIILTAHENPAYEPVIVDGKVQQTFCNLFCNEVARGYGCTDFIDMEKNRVRNADEIYDFVSSHCGANDDWEEILCSTLSETGRDIAFTAAQFWANSGTLVIAVANSTMLKAEHGHCCIIRPGTQKSSGKWGKVPAVANVGGENFIALGKNGVMKGLPVGLNEAFKIIPRIFAWKGL